ncbi:FAD-binding oxidoreductase [Sulfitobacter sp. LCG007]
MTLTDATPEFARLIKAQLPEDVLRPTEPRYLEEPRGRYSGVSGLLALPRTVEQVSTLVRLAAEHRVGILPYGGGTGLVGGQLLPDGAAPLILSLERMNRIRGIWPEENTMICEAGVILAEAQAAAEASGRLFPLSLAAEGTARIGGNLSSNAGGTAVLRYGNARELCLGLEAVLPDGQIWHGLRRLRKDNTGYDLRNLLIGAEGTLGVITAATLKLFPRPAAVGTALFVVPSPAAGLSLLTLAREQLGDMVTAFELISGQGFDFLAEKQPDLRLPFETPPEWSILLEISLPRGIDPQQALETLFAEGNEAGIVLDGVIAQNMQQAGDFWAVRERIPEANRAIGAVSSHDLSLPLGAIAEFIQRAPDLVRAIGNFRINCFGHLGDGNLHYNVFPAKGRTKADEKDKSAAVMRALHDLVHEMGGSVSAEHGIGRLKVEDLERYSDPAKLSAMRSIKAALDPLGIMNPGAVLRAQ